MLQLKKLLRAGCVIHPKVMTRLGGVVSLYVRPLEELQSTKIDKVERS